METTFPFATFGFDEYFSSSIEVAKPFIMKWVFKVLPGVLVHFFEPLRATFITC
jgi:hypothetical protein